MDPDFELSISIHRKREASAVSTLLINADDIEAAGGLAPFLRDRTPAMIESVIEIITGEKS